VQKDSTLLSKLGTLDPTLHFTGTQINYYFVCKRKLWFFSHNMELESDSDLVHLGKLLHEHSCKRKLKEVGVGSLSTCLVLWHKTIPKILSPN